MQRRIINKKSARKLVLPRLSLTEVVCTDHPHAVEVAIAGETYFVRPCHDEVNGGRLDSQPKWKTAQFNLFPVVLCSDGAPWAEATVYILSRLEGSISPTMGSFASIADDLTAYRQFLDDFPHINWIEFPKNKLLRPTYRFRAQLGLQINAGEIAASTARRRMSSVIRFYRWLRAEQVLMPDNTPWIETDKYIEVIDARGMKGAIKVQTTDLRVSIPKQSDPFADSINDGGRLRPLPQHEQRWLLDALIEHGHTELTLIHLFALVTGARIQTILTFKVGSILARHLVSPFSEDVRIPVGPGTGIDTKGDKQMTLLIPVWFYEKLATYAHSKRAAKRRERAKGGDTLGQYLFLSARGVPLYESKADAAIYDDTNVLRHSKRGQAIRQLITDYIKPIVRKAHAPQFHYQFHDLRATYGMNLTDEQLKKVARGEITLHEAREFVKSCMGHASASTTDLYLEYRGKLEFTRSVNNGWGDHLEEIASRALKGL